MLNIWVGEWECCKLEPSVLGGREEGLYYLTIISFLLRDGEVVYISMGVIS